MGAIMYAGDADDTMLLSNWADGMMPYVKNKSLFKAPPYIQTEYFGYALNIDAVGINLTTVESPSSFIALFDSTNLQWSATASPSTRPNPGRYAGRNTWTFLDGTPGSD